MSVDLSQTHLKTVHVISIMVALIGAGLYIGKAYFGMTLVVHNLELKQEGIPSFKDIEHAKAECSTELSHAASERVKFYMEKAKWKCTGEPSKHSVELTCKTIWPPPEN